MAVPCGHCVPERDFTSDCPSEKMHGSSAGTCVDVCVHTQSKERLVAPRESLEEIVIQKPLRRRLSCARRIGRCRHTCTSGAQKKRHSLNTHTHTYTHTHTHKRAHTYTQTMSTKNEMCKTHRAHVLGGYKRGDFISFKGVL